MLEGVEVDVALSERGVDRDVVAEGLHVNREALLRGNDGDLFGDLFRRPGGHAERDFLLFRSRAACGVPGLVPAPGEKRRGKENG